MPRAPRVIQPPIWVGVLSLFVHHVLVLLVSPIWLPVLLWRLATSERYREGLLARMGWVAPTQGNRRVIWIHGVSVGEIKAAGSLIAMIRRELPEAELVVSTTTPTGHNMARMLYEDVRVIFYPIDLGFFPGRSLDRIRPDCVLLVELEIWPNFLTAAARRGIPVAVINGRISEGSFRGYRIIRPLLPQLRWVRVFCVQDEAYRDRLEALGVDPARIEVTGSLKYDGVAMRDVPPETGQLESWLRGPVDAQVLVCGSTHGREDAWLAQVAREVSEATGLPLRLVLAPRHPERSAAVGEALDEAGIPYLRWSTLGGRRPRLAEEVVVVDTIGQLESFYAASDVAFVGGSLVPHGGQNMLEPAAMGKPVVFGPHTTNFRRDVELLVGGEAAIQVNDLDQLRDQLVQLMTEADYREGFGKRAVRLIRRNEGATQRTFEVLDPLISGSARDR